MRKKMKPYVSHRIGLIEDLKDPKFAAAYLNAALEEDREGFLMALRNVMEAHGGVAAVARRAKINRVSLYKISSRKGNPEFGSVLALCQALNVKLRLVPAKRAVKSSA
jgi:probable addiction module antidote protein